MPNLSERHRQLLGAVISRQTIGEMADGLHLSAASVKRELGALYRSLGVTDRVGLSSVAIELGVPPRPIR